METAKPKKNQQILHPMFSISLACNFDLGSIELAPILTELDLTANRLYNLDPWIGFLSSLKNLSFRQNLIEDSAVEPLSRWVALKGLEELVFRDNKLRRIPNVSIFERLLVFDVSFNEITSLNGLSKVSRKLKELYVSKNEVTKIEEIDHFHQLRILELGSNRLRVMEILQNLKILEELWLGRNRVKTVNLRGLKSLKKISLQSNRLTSMTGFEAKSSNYSATVKQYFPNIQQIDSNIYA